MIYFRLKVIAILQRGLECNLLYRASNDYANGFDEYVGRLQRRLYFRSTQFSAVFRVYATFRHLFPRFCTRANDATNHSTAVTTRRGEIMAWSGRSEIKPKTLYSVYNAPVYNLNVTIPLIGLETLSPCTLDARLVVA